MSGVLQSLINNEVFKIFLSFILGFISSYVIAKIVEKQKLAKLRKFYLSWLKYSIQNVNIQLERLNFFNENIKKNFNNTPNLEFNRSQLDQVSNLSKEELYDIFVLRKRGDVDKNAKFLHELVGCIDYLITFNDDLGQKYMEFRNEMKEINSSLSIVMNGFNSSIDRYILKLLNSSEGFANQILDLKESLNKNYNESTINPDIYFKILVEPSRALLIKHLIENGDEILISAKEYSQNFKDVLLLRDKAYIRFSKTLDHYTHQIEITVKSLNGKIKYFEES